MKRVLIFIGLKLWEIGKFLFKWIGYFLIAVLIMGVVASVILGLLFSLGWMTLPIWNLTGANLFVEKGDIMISQFVDNRILTGSISLVAFGILTLLISRFIWLINRRYVLTDWIKSNWIKAGKIANKK